MNGNGINNMRPQPPPQHFPPGQMGGPFNPMAQQSRPLDPHHAPGPFAGPNPQMDAMSHQFRGLNVDNDVAGRGRTGFDQAPLRRTPSVDDDEEPITYEGWTLYRAEPSTSQQKPNWSCATRSPMHLSQNELIKLVQKRKKKTVAQQYNELGRQKREQIDRLIEDRKLDDNDPRFDWSVVYINTVTKDVGRRGMTTEYVTLSLDIIIRRSLRPGASVTARAEKASNLPEVVNLNRPREQAPEKGRGNAFPDPQFLKSPHPFPQQNGQFPGPGHGPPQHQNGPPSFIQLNHDGPASPQHRGFPPHEGGFPRMQQQQQQQQPMQRPPPGIEILNGPMNHLPPQNHPQPPHLQPRQEPQVIPPLVREPPIQLQKQKPPKIINPRKKSPMKEKGIKEWLETDSSVGDDESVLFELDNESSATEDSFFLDEHEKLPPSRGHSQQRPSKGRQQSEPIYRGHQRPPIKYPASPDRRQHDPFYERGPVDIIPEKSIGRRPGQLSRSTSVSYPAKTRQLYEDRSDRRRPLSPFRNDMLSPPIRFNQPSFTDDFARDREWERAQHEREREISEHVRNSRIREKEEDLIHRQRMLDREDDLRRREKSLEYREIKLEQEQAQTNRALRDRADSFDRFSPIYPADGPRRRADSFERGSPVYPTDAPRRRADSFERVSPVYPADGPRHRADSFERVSPVYPIERPDPVDRIDRMDRVDHIERGRRPPLDSRRQSDYFFDGPPRPFR